MVGGQACIEGTPGGLGRPHLEDWSGHTWRTGVATPGARMVWAESLLKGLRTPTQRTGNRGTWAGDQEGLEGSSAQG